MASAKGKRSAKKTKAPTVKQLRERAKKLGLKGYSKLRREQLVEAVADAEGGDDAGAGDGLGARLRVENAARSALADAALAERDAGTDETAKKTREPEGGWAEAWMERFIAHLANGGTVSKACELAVVGRATAYRHRQSDEDFALAWADAEQESTERLEEEAFRRAFKGVRKPVHYQGLVVDFVEEYSDTMLIFLLKARKPDKYRERFDHRHSGGVARPTLPGGGTLDLSKLTQKQIDQLEELLEQAATTEEA